VHGLDIVEGKINNDDVSVLRDTGGTGSSETKMYLPPVTGTSSILCGTDVFT
jgi:hypothetical protein